MRAIAKYSFVTPGARTWAAWLLNNSERNASERMPPPQPRAEEPKGLYVDHLASQPAQEWAPAVAEFQAEPC